MERERWSHSKLVRLWSCGEAYRREDVEREERPPSSSMVRGTAFHHAAAVAHGRQLAAKLARPGDPKSLVLREALPSEEEAGDLAATAFNREAAASGIVSPADETDVPPSRVIGRDKDAAVKMARYHVSTLAPYVDPIAVESKVIVEPADLPIRVSGIFDLVTDETGNPHGGRRAVRDWKTAYRRPNKNAAHDSGQLSLYQLLDVLQAAKESRAPADVFALDYVVQDPKRFTAPYVVSLETTRTQEDLAVTVARLNNAIAAVKTGTFLANGVGSWQCSPKWCRFWSTCRFVSKAQR